MTNLCPLRRMEDVELGYKRVLIREDFNVPMQAGQITNDARLRAALPTIRYALEQGASVILLSHLGRPTEGVFDETYSLKPVAARLSELLQQPVRFEKDLSSAELIHPGEVVLLENVRFFLGESRADEALSRAFAHLAEVFVMDAFASAHRQHASTYGLSRYAHASVAGPLLSREVDALCRAFQDPVPPVVAIVGGAKVSTKLQVLCQLIEKVNILILGGGIANTFLMAQGYDVGASLYEPDWVQTARDILQKAQDRGVAIPLPLDVRTGMTLEGSMWATKTMGESFEVGEKILDIGPQTEQLYAGVLEQARTIIWNGPLGVFENPNFASGTRHLAQCIAESSAFSLAGGGDTVAAIEQFGVEQGMGYISTAGGAFLEFLEGRPFPCIDILRGVQHEIA